MKFIPKFLRGLSFYTVFDTVGVPKTSSGSEKAHSGQSSKKSDDDGKVTEKDLFTMLKDIDGLPNERQELYLLLQDIFTMNKLTGRSIEDISLVYLKSLFYLKTAADNKKQYDKAFETAFNNGAMNEPAISPDGKLIVLNSDGSLGSVSLKDYSANPEEYKGRIMTVSNIAHLRAYDSDFINKNLIFDIMNNSMGFEAFQTLIDKAHITLQNSSQTRNGQFAVLNKVIKGLEEFEKLKDDPRVKQITGSITLDGLYEYNIIESSNIELINSYVQYLVNTLPDRAKTWAAFKMGNPNKNEATKALVFNYLLGKLSQSHTVKTDYKGSFDKVTGGSSGSSSKSDLKLNTASKWAIGFGDSLTMILNVGDVNFREVRTNTMPLVKMNGDYLGANSTLLDVSDGLYKSILDMTNISMGMATINTALLNLVVLTDGNITSIDFPCIEKDGIVVPDLSRETSLKKREADAEIIQMGINLKDKDSIKLNYQTINSIYKKHGLSAAYDSNGDPNNKTWRRFGVINGITDGRVLGPQVDKRLVETVTDDYVADNIISVIKQNNKGYTSTRKDWWGADLLYKGTIWIPTRIDIHSALASEELKVDDALEIEKKQLASDIRNLLQLGRQLKN